MTRERQPMRNLVNKINENKNNRTFAECIVKSIQWTSKTAEIEVLPERAKAIARVAFSKASKDEIDGAMPTVGSRGICIFLNSTNNLYDDVILTDMFLHDDINTKPSREIDGNKDKNYHSIKPKNGGKIDMYKGNDNKDKVLIQSKNHLNLLAQDFVSVGAKEISGDDNWVVVAKHFEVYNRAVQELIDFTKWVISNPPSIVTPSTPPTPAPFLNVYNPILVTAKFSELEAKLTAPTNSGGLKEGIGQSNKSNKLKAST